MPKPWSTQGAIVAGAGAALGASACCAGPLVLVTLGLGGAWTSRMAVAFDPDKASPRALTDATADAGHPSSVGQLL